MAKYDSLANKFHLRHRVCERFRENILVLWEHGIASHVLFLRYLNTMDQTGRINSTMEFESDTGLEDINLKLKIVKSKIKNHVFAKFTTNFSYTARSNWDPKRNITNIPKRICYND